MRLLAAHHPTKSNWTPAKPAALHIELDCTSCSARLHRSAVKCGIIFCDGVELWNKVPNHYVKGHLFKVLLETTSSLEVEFQQNTHASSRKWGCRPSDWANGSQQPHSLTAGWLRKPYCCDLNYKIAQQACVLSTWFPADGSVGEASAANGYRFLRGVGSWRL